MDREKLIKGLEICKSSDKTCSDCPYNGEVCTASLCDDVLTLLKEQEEKIENLEQEIRDKNQRLNERAEQVDAMLKEQETKTQGADSGMCEIFSFYERALPVKPHYNSRTNWYECGACHYSMTSGMICRSELIPACKVGFCAKCGKAVMWE